MEKVAVFGEALFDLIEQSDGSIQPFIGGSPFNVARSFAKQGLKISYLSPISTDEYGKRIYDYATSEKIQIPSNNRSDLPTSLALVYTDANGQVDYRLYRKFIADLDISADQLINLINTEIALFHTGSLVLVPSMKDTLTQCFNFLKEKQIPLSLDINMRKGVETDQDSYINAVLALLPFAGIVKVSDEDLQLLGYDDAPLEGAKKVLSQLDNGMVLLTQGEKGATLLTNSLSIHLNVFEPEEFVDAVGAGDTFFSAFLSRLVKSGQINERQQTQGLEDALRYGLMAATLNVEKSGCQPPNELTVLGALKANNIQLNLS